MTDTRESAEFPAPDGDTFVVFCTNGQFIISRVDSDKNTVATFIRDFEDMDLEVLTA
jgi:hypothetical protein